MSTLPDSPVSFAHQDLHGRSFKNAVLRGVSFHQTICGITWSMPNQHTQTISHSHIIGSTLNLGEISGQVQNAVEQLATTTPEQLNLKETLQRLHKLPPN